MKPLAPAAARRTFVTLFRLLRRYHRFEVLGEEYLPKGRSALIAGYHGRIVALDLLMLQELLLCRTGRLPRAFGHRIFSQNRVLRAIHDGLGFLAADGSEVAAAVSDGELLIVTPGGAREACRGLHDRYRVSWPARYGYLKVAARYGLPILPAASTGVDETYFCPFDANVLIERLGLPRYPPPYVAIGPLGLFPFSLPFPVKITLRIGQPIHPRDFNADPDHPETLGPLHAAVVSAVQSLLDVGLCRTQTPTVNSPENDITKEKKWRT